MLTLAIYNRHNMEPNMARRKANLSQSSGPSLPPAIDRIMLAAEQLFSAHGIGNGIGRGIGDDLKTIANRATTNVDAIIKYFGSWEGLVIQFLGPYSRKIDMRWEEMEEEEPGDPL